MPLIAQSLLRIEVHFKINAEKFIFTIVQQAARLVCLFFFFYEIKDLLPDFVSLNLMPSEPIASKSPKGALSSSHEFSSINIFQSPSALTEKFVSHLRTSNHFACNHFMCRAATPELGMANYKDWLMLVQSATCDMNQDVILYQFSAECNEALTFNICYSYTLWSQINPW